jgi:phosphatidylglycerol:prolipoprotein diacylglycerol transferase
VTVVMRKVLLRFVFDNLWQWQSFGNELHVGAAWLMLGWIVGVLIATSVMFRVTKDLKESLAAAGFWLIVPVILLVLGIVRPNIGLVNDGIPVFGYGFMMFVGFSMATWLASRRVLTIGQPPEVIWDMMMWALIPGLIGARLYYLGKYGGPLLAKAQGLGKLIAAVALWDGGIVFYGGVMGGIVGVTVFCFRRGISPLAMFDVLAPSLLIGEGFGRIGCFLYGCCYGKACDLPWAVKFPPDSLTFEKLAQDGVIARDAASTIALHPTQIYSSAAAFVLAGILAWYFRRRPFDGAVMCLTSILYPVSRYVLETLRGDIDPGALGLKDAQVFSIVLTMTGIAGMYYLSKHRKLTTASGRTTPAPGK